MRTWPWATRRAVVAHDETSKSAHCAGEERRVGGERAGKIRLVQDGTKGKSDVGIGKLAAVEMTARESSERESQARICVERGRGRTGNRCRRSRVGVDIARAPGVPQHSGARAIDPQKRAAIAAEHIHRAYRREGDDLRKAVTFQVRHDGRPVAARGDRRQKFGLKQCGRHRPARDERDRIPAAIDRGITGPRAVRMDCVYPRIPRIHEAGLDEQIGEISVKNRDWQSSIALVYDREHFELAVAVEIRNRRGTDDL